jgi:hypothetical protein
MTFLFEEEIIKTKKAMIFISNKDESNNLYLEVVSQDLATVWGRKRKRSLLLDTQTFPRKVMCSLACVCVWNFGFGSAAAARRNISNAIS